MSRSNPRRRRRSRRPSEPPRERGGMSSPKKPLEARESHGAQEDRTGRRISPATLQVLYEDESVIVACKPDGLLTQGDRTGDPSLFSQVQQHLQRSAEEGGRRPFVGLVHRLDRPVWGVVVFAKSSRAAASLSKQFREGRVRKIYHAVVEGLPEELEGTLANWLLRREGKSSRVYDKPVTDGQEVRLEYRVIGANPQRGLLEIEPHTGRKHQIRAQLAHLGHPIIGDRRYGAKDLLPGGRLALMAKELEFEHPDSEKILHVKAPAPPWWPEV